MQPADDVKFGGAFADGRRALSVDVELHCEPVKHAVEGGDALLAGQVFHMAVAHLVVAPADDLREGRGPENIDGKATGSTLKDFLRVIDLAPLEVGQRRSASMTVSER